MEVPYNGQPKRPGSPSPMASPTHSTASNTGLLQACCGRCCGQRYQSIPFLATSPGKDKVVLVYQDKIEVRTKKQHHRGATPDTGGQEEEMNDVRSASEAVSRASLNQAAKPNSTTSTASVVVNLPSSYPASEVLDGSGTGPHQHPPPPPQQHQQAEAPADNKQQSVVRISTL